MELPVLIEPIAGNGYRASSGPPLACSAEGATADEALRKLQQLVEGRLTAGEMSVPLKVSATHPLAAQAGIFKDDPLFDEWQQAIAEYRQQRNEELERGEP